MYIKELQLENYGPIENFKYSMPFDSNGNPLPVVLIGKNGVGKTILLSNILHSLIETKRKFYNTLQEVSEDNYYRVGSKQYIKSGKNSSYFKVEFNNNSHFVDLMVMDYDLYKSNYDRDSHPNVDLNNDKLKKDGFFHNLKQPTENVFTKNVFLYFPVDRYYIPTWENKDNENLKFITDEQSFIGINNTNIVQYNLLSSVESWILDVVIDKLLYEEKTINETIGEHTITRQFYSGKNTNIQTTINSILSKIFTNRPYQSVRIGVSNKEHRKISVIGVYPDRSEEQIVPKFSNLSSGEMMIFGIFISIIKAYDKATNSQSIDFNTVSGIVMIDEIDTHLHSDLLKDVLPSLIKMFPKIQFIITSHSPFFLLGMQETFDKKCQFVALPTGTIMENIEYFDEIKRCYSIIDSSYENILNAFNKYQNDFKNLTKPLIITEGKTDWKHLKHALSVFNTNGDFTDLDLEFLEYSENLGDKDLENLLKNLAKIPRSNIIIGVFDNDSKIGQTYIDSMNLGNKVFACSIKDTLGYNCEVSIELLYRREELCTVATDGRRIYLSDEFTEKSKQLKTDSCVVCHNQTLIDAFKRGIIKIVDKQVFDNNENSLALSKETFASNILNEVEPFVNFSVDGFKDIFNTIHSIIFSESN